MNLQVFHVRFGELKKYVSGSTLKVSQCKFMGTDGFPKIVITGTYMNAYSRVSIFQ
jgi:hypothetical protein